MADPRIVILGASVAGLKAAARARRLLPDASVTVVDRRTFVSYGACGLPYYLSGEIQQIDTLRSTSYGAVRDEAYFAATRDIEVLTGHQVLGIDRDARAVSIERLGDGARTMLMYDQLVYAFGSEPIVPEGVELGGAVTTGGLPEDVAVLRQDLERGGVDSVIVMGGGAVGLETAAALADLWDCEVTVLELGDELLARQFDPEMARLVTAHLQRHGVDVQVGVGVKSVCDRDDRVLATLENGEELVADRAVVALGVMPNTAVARATGLAIGDHGGVVVDANLRTSDPFVLAVGDCIELIHHVTGEVVVMPMGSLASRQGRVAGDVLAGLESEFPAILGSIALRVLGLNLAATGLTEGAARRAGIEARVAWGAFDDRSDFHPERERIYLKVVYERKSLRLLGLQAIGPGDVTKRVDVVASLLRREARLTDLLDLEWCYSPPFNAGLDPLHSLAGAALNTDGLDLQQVAPGSDLAGYTVVDVRTADEFAGSEPAVPGTLNIPIEELRARLDEVPGGEVVMICAKGSRSAEAALMLARRGQVARYAAGGVTWQGDVSS